MARITDPSRHIPGGIHVIDGAAVQTNILALSAADGAARAGDNRLQGLRAL